MFTGPASIMLPDGTMPAINDSNPFPIRSHSLDPLALGAKLFDRDAFRYLSDVSGWQALDPQAARLYFDSLSQTGLAVMRSGWDKQAKYLLLSADPWGGITTTTTSASFCTPAAKRCWRTRGTSAMTPRLPNLVPDARRSQRVAGG